MKLAVLALLLAGGLISAGFGLHAYGAQSSTQTIGYYLDGTTQLATLGDLGTGKDLVFQMPAQYPKISANTAFSIVEHGTTEEFFMQSVGKKKNLLGKWVDDPHPAPKQPAVNSLLQDQLVERGLASKDQHYSSSGGVFELRTSPDGQQCDLPPQNWFDKRPANLESTRSEFNAFGGLTLYYDKGLPSGKYAFACSGCTTNYYVLLSVE